MNGDILTSLAGAIDLSLNQFLAQKSLNEARAAGILDNAIEIELDEDDPSQGDVQRDFLRATITGARVLFARGKRLYKSVPRLLFPAPDAVLRTNSSI
jgi:hypothetical protein